MRRNFSFISHLFRDEINYLCSMKIINLLPSFLLGLVLFACVPEVAYRGLDEFQIDETAINNKDELELLYASASPTNEEHLTYFVHAVALVKSTGDTVNVLTPFNRGAGGGAAKNIFKFYTLNSEEGQAYFKKLYQDPEAPKQYSFEAIEKINRVTYDKRFDYIAKNSFPSIIGFLDK